jgi:RNA polymerase sigma-70 factor (ECF subfamily)
MTYTKRVAEAFMVKDMEHSSTVGAESSPMLVAREGEPNGPAIAGEFEAFFEVENMRLFRAMYLVTGNVEEAEEATQEAFLKVWERWDRVAAMANPTGYLYRTAMNQFRSHYRRAARAAAHAVSGPRQRDLFAEADDRDVIAQALRTLAPRQRAALVLTELLGHSSEDAAEILRVKAGTVRALAYQAREVLRNKLEGFNE